MTRNFGISLLLFGLLLAGIDGFRVRERAGSAPGAGLSNGTTSDVHVSEAIAIPPAR